MTTEAITPLRQRMVEDRGANSNRIAGVDGL